MTEDTDKSILEVLGMENETKLDIEEAMDIAAGMDSEEAEYELSRYLSKVLYRSNKDELVILINEAAELAEEPSFTDTDIESFLIDELAVFTDDLTNEIFNDYVGKTLKETYAYDYLSK